MTKSCNLQKYISDEFKSRPLQFKWNTNATQHFCFRLRINEGTGELWRTARPESENGSCETVNDTISLKDELRQMNGQIIQCIRNPHRRQMDFRSPTNGPQTPKWKIGYQR